MDFNEYDFFVAADVLDKCVFLDPGSLQERILEILQEKTPRNKSLKTGDFVSKIKACLLIQFEERQDLFLLEELISLYNTLHGPTVEYEKDIKFLVSYKRLLNHVKHSLISFAGLEEFNERENLNLSDVELLAFKKSMVIDPILIWSKSKDLEHLLRMYDSEETMTAKEKLRKRRLLSPKKFFLNFAKDFENLTYIAWKEKKKEYLMLYELKNKLKPKSKIDILNLFEQIEATYKFNFDKKSLSIIRKLRKKNMYGKKISHDELSELSNRLSKQQFERSLKVLWRGLKIEFNRIKKVKNLKIKKLRLLVFFEKYQSSPYSERIWRIIRKIFLQSSNKLQML